MEIMCWFLELDVGLIIRIVEELDLKLTVNWIIDNSWQYKFRFMLIL